MSDRSERDLDEFDALAEVDARFDQAAWADYLKIAQVRATHEHLLDDPMAPYRCADCGKVKPIKSGGMCAACARADQRRRQRARDSS